ncbi:RNA polymerase-associated protein Rtf1 [Drosophila madeirensis]|uniref:RNA polymerase-associated protein Rtf1 n=1 Tax=Drosophila madeirensis TaxID=30013 RepID=A0AAU9FYV1_DROMD
MQSRANPLPTMAKSRRQIANMKRELRSLKPLTLRVGDERDEQPQKPSLVDRPVKRLDQLEPVRLTRHRLIQLLLRPAHEQSVLGCFVRVRTSVQGEPPIYHVAEIMDIKQVVLGYLVDELPTNIGLRLRYQGTVTTHELNDISNVSCTQPEFQLWYDWCVNQAIRPPTLGLVASKRMELHHALQSEAKAVALIKQGFTLIMRPVPRGGILERHGAKYPWRLQRPPQVEAQPEPQSQQEDLQLLSEMDESETG